MKLLRTLALIWMFAWLPLSGVMAATMPFCAQGIMGMAAMHEAMAMGDTARTHESDADAPCHQAAESDGEAPLCGQCDLCHIAGALVPPSLPAVLHAIDPISPVDASRTDFTSFFPEPLPRPPLASRD
jgi:hypothetical protein